MSYISSSIGPSPFLTASHHHYHSSASLTSSHPHYTTNSYTNVPTYLAAYATPAQVFQQKYFPKDVINVLPGVTNLQSQEQQKLIHPLNTYSGNVFSTYRINSPFNRGQIYLPNKSSMASSYSDFSTSTMLDNKTSESYLYKKDNPFNKKYLLTEKNQQLQNYAHYSQGQKYQFTESVKQRSKPSQRNAQKYLDRRQPTFSNEEIANEVLGLKSRPKINITNRQDYRQQTYSKKQSRSDKDSSDKNPFQTHVLGQNYQQEDLVESEVDQKQFGSFGQGKQPYNSSLPSYKSYENSKENLKTRKQDKRNEKNDNNDKAQSIIVGLSKFSSNNEQQRHQKAKNSRPKSKKQLVFIDSEDDQRRSGTFVVPNAIIDEINNTRVASNAIRRKDNQSMQSYERQYERQQFKYTKQEAIQVGKNPPNIITLRGKTFEKISL